MHDQALLERWCADQMWPEIGTVVTAGMPDEGHELLLEFKPSLVLIAFAPSGVDAPTLDGVHIAPTLPELRARVASLMQPHLALKALVNPALQDEWGPRINAEIQGGVSSCEVMQVTGRLHSKAWIDQGLSYLPHLVDRPCTTTCGEPFDGAVGVVVGSGPSLTAQLETLRGLQGRAVIAACSSTVSVLASEGIQPDIVCAMEHQWSSYARGIDSAAWANAVAVCGLHVHPDVWTRPALRIVPAIQAVGAFGSWLMCETGLEGLLTGGSVATLAYGWLRRLGCKTIAMVGIDCAIGRDRQLYADGAGSMPVVFERVGGKLSNTGAGLHCDELRSEAWGGIGFVSTFAALDHYRHWFEYRAADPRGDVRHINSSVGGARIEGWEEQRLDEVSVVEEQWAPRDALVAAIDAAPKLEAGLLVKGLEEQLKALAPLKKKALATADTLRVWMDRSAELSAALNTDEVRLLNGYALGPPEEIGRWPRGDSLQVVKVASERMAARADELRPRIEAALAALEG